MSFKAHIATTGAFRDIDKKVFRIYISPPSYDFTKNKIHLHGKNITVLKPEFQIFDQSQYSLICLEKDSECYSKNSPFQAKFENGITVNLVTNLWQRLRIRWTHKLTWWQKENSWVIKTAIATLIGATISYYFSYRVGFQDGLKKGLESEKQQDSLPLTLKPIFTIPDTIHKVDTSFHPDSPK